jgi:hypothetical protein
VLVRYRERTRPQSVADAPGATLLATLLAPEVACLDVSISELDAQSRGVAHMEEGAEVVNEVRK